jgi:hypothetical protein
VHRSDAGRHQAEGECQPEAGKPVPANGQGVSIRAEFLFYE